MSTGTVKAIKDVLDQNISDARSKVVSRKTINLLRITTNPKTVTEVALKKDSSKKN